MMVTDEELLEAIKRHVRAATDGSVSEQEFEDSFLALVAIAEDGSLVRV